MKEMLTVARLISEPELRALLDSVDASGILSWCDLCIAQNQRELATSSEDISLSSVRGGARSLDLCDVHRKELLTPVIDAVNEHGARVQSSSYPNQLGHQPGKKHVDGPFYCQVVGCKSNGVRGYSNSGSLGSHLRTAHGLTLSEYRERYDVQGYGPTEPTPLSEAPPTATTTAATPSPRDDDFYQRFECDVEGCDVVYSKSLGHNKPSQALGMHRARLHGIRSEKSKRKNHAYFEAQKTKSA